MDGTGPGPGWSGWGVPSVACAANPWANQVAHAVVLGGGNSWGPAPPVAVLSDADVERIAQRVAAILREPKP